MGAEPQAPRQAIDRALQIAVVERHKAPTGVAKQVMVVLPRGVDQLVANRRIAQLQPSDQPVLLKQIQDAVDAGARHATLAVSQSVLDLQGTEGTPLLGKQVDHQIARAAPTVPSLIEHCPRMLGPLGSDCT
jgi:hypothetical protein